MPSSRFPRLYAAASLKRGPPGPDFRGFMPRPQSRTNVLNRRSSLPDFGLYAAASLKRRRDTWFGLSISAALCRGLIEARW